MNSRVLFLLSMFRNLPLVPISISALIVLVWLLPVDQWLEYHRALIGQGQLWRLLTANLAHIDGSHLLFNLAGLWLMAWWFGSALSQLKWLVVTLACGLAVTGGLFLFYPDPLWYRGFSGVLYGLFAAGSVFMISTHRWLALAGLALVVIKLVGDASGWPVVGSEPMHDFRVVHQAHHLGFIMGALVAVLWSRVSGQFGSGFLRTES
ncbi:rhombosortase [Marinobacter sp. M216]|uniref:Rhombosortase n=1 Tax=Marinobacter albus TaxID=3030833 RepID=A0ABT7HFI9_9GAMM|nr:rhombosortase [Marinobacter sp. M216]MDK9559141.1 rhombosortase [Marinobacter sp. M216]